MLDRPQLVLAGLIIVTTVAVVSAQDSDATKADPWFAKENIRLINRIKDGKAKEAQYIEAIAEARSIEAAAAAANEPKSLGIAREAIKTGEAGLRKLQAEIKADTEAQKAFDRATRWQLAGRTVAVPTSVTGTVSKETKTGSISFDPNAPLLVGETIRTAPDSSITISFENGTSVQLFGQSEFTFTEQKGLSSLFDLRKGRFSVRRFMSVLAVRGSNDPDVRVRTPTVVAAVRGTEFEMNIDGKGFTHFIPISGIVEIASTVESGAPEQASWWRTRPVALEVRGLRIYKDDASELSGTGVDQSLIVLTKGRFHILNGMAERSLSVGNFDVAASIGDFEITISDSVDIVAYRGNLVVSSKQNGQ